MFDRICLWRHLVLGFYFLEDFKSQSQFQCLWLVCVYFLFLPGSVMEGCAFLRICPFLPGCPFSWHIVPCSNLLWPLYFCSVSCYFSFFISNSVDLNLLLFFLMNLANGLSILFIFSQNQLLVLLIFAIISFISFSFISDLIFMISFLLLTLGFFCSSFSNCFRCKVRLFIWGFSYFLR